ncbi:hypothetical protein O0L34_g4615 [Tuta absoluta]|nr:hypothetical protein O0L34_g4615 [Tuta absoluta]
MVQCRKCKMFLSLTKDEIVKCKGSCDGVYHKKCAEKMKCFKQGNGMCDGCLQNEASPKTQVPKITIDIQKATVESLLAEVNNKLEVIYKTQEQMQVLSETVDFYAEQYQKMLESTAAADKKIKCLEQKNTYLDKYTKSLEERIIVLEQKEKEKNVEIVGLEKREREDLTQVVINIANKLDLNHGEIEEVKRVGVEKQRADKVQPQPVIVTLRTKAAKEEWMKQRKYKLTNGKVYNDSSEGRVYLNEDLSKYLRQLFWVAKRDLKEHYAYIWVQNSRILAKASESNKKIHAIRSEDDIKRLLDLVNE